MNIKKMQSKRDLLNRKWLPSIVSVLLIGLLASVWTYQRREQFDRLQEIGGSSVPFIVLTGHVLRCSIDQNGPQIVSCPVDRSAYSALVHEDRKLEIVRSAAGFPMLSCDGRKIYYAVEKYRPPTFGSPGNSGMSIRALGDYSAPRDRARPGAGEQSAPAKAPAGEAQSVIKSIEVVGGSQKTVAAAPTPAAIADGTAIWVRPDPTSKVTLVTDGEDHWREVSGGAQITILSLAKALTRVVHSERPTDLVVPCRDGVIWSTLRPFPDAGRDVHYARSSDGTVQSLGQITESQRPLTALEFKGRCYWIIDDQNGGQNEMQLYSADIGKKGEKWAESVKSTPLSPVVDQWNRPSLFIDRERLLCVMRPASDGSSRLGQSSSALLPGGGDWPCGLYQITGDNGLSTRRIRDLPGESASYQYDQGYLYFIHRDLYRTPMATISGDNAGSRNTTTLCRIVIPP